VANFKDRQKAQEAKFAHDAELRFKADARRNKLLGLWVATKIGHTDPESYAGEVVASDFEEAGDEDVFRKVSGDIAAKGASVSEEELRAKMSELAAVAREQVFNES
jgi:hypothetical protein